MTHDPLEGIPSLQELSGKSYVTLRVAAKLIGVTYQTALRYIKKGPDIDGQPGRPVRLMAYRVGGEWRIDEREMRRFLSGIPLPKETNPVPSGINGNTSANSDP